MINDVVCGATRNSSVTSVLLFVVLVTVNITSMTRPGGHCYMAKQEDHCLISCRGETWPRKLPEIPGSFFRPGG